MRRYAHRSFLLLIYAAMLGFLPAAAAGQTTIFNIPTPDTLPRGSWGLEVDFITKPVSYGDGGYQTYGYRVAYGLTNDTEIGSNFYATYDGSETAAQAEFSLKQRVYQNEDHGLTVAGGAVVFVPLRARNGDKTAVMAYGNVGKTIQSLKGMSLTGGVYYVFGGSTDFGDRTGLMVGMVQPVTNRVSFIADWFSGKNRLGYASAGFNYNITKRQYLLTGYSFGNSGRGNNAFAAYYGITF